MDDTGWGGLLSGGLLVAAMFLMVSGGCADGADEGGVDRDTFRRRTMVERLKDRGIRSPTVLEAMAKVPRHAFVPDSHRSLAYEVRPLPIGYEQTISSPYLVAYMTEAAEIAAGEKVLEIGTGSGYQAAVLAVLTDSVFSIEIIPELAETARRRLRDLGYATVRVKTGNGYLGWPDHAPFDAIVVTAAPDRVPQTLIDQLALHGRMVIPVGRHRQEMMVITRADSGVVTERTLPVRFVPMVSPPDPAP